jgi:hypothetical protein
MRTSEPRGPVGVSPEEYAREHGLQPDHVRSLLRRGQISGRQFGRIWRVLPDAPAHDDHDAVAEARAEAARLREELAAIKARIEAVLR